MDRHAPAIEELDAGGAAREAAALAAVLHACVAAGASVGFVQPFTPAEAEAWWRGQVVPSLARGERRLLVARLGGGRPRPVVGTAQLAVATMPNQRHRAEVSKVLVHPDARRRGVARALMLRLEALAAGEGRVLLTLDTRAGDAAQPLYASLGYALAGVIPRYARAPAAQHLEATAIMYKELVAPLAGATA
jgi:ribosomal protein S18 acetylase RimI-like enzyme